MDYVLLMHMPDSATPSRKNSVNQQRYDLKIEPYEGRYGM